MKTTTKMLFLALILLTSNFVQAQLLKGFSLKPSQKLTNLPALQSFVFAKSGSYWLLIGGRTNGFHGFAIPTGENFPFKKANKFIYVYNTATNKLDSMSTIYLPQILREQYTSSNMQHTQVGNYLYITGGYGEYHAKRPDSTWTTYSTLSRVNVSTMITAILAKNKAQLLSSVVYAKDNLTAATGGELYKLPDGKFYLTLGHRFMGTYSDFFVNPKIQSYLDSVHVFRLSETATSISIIPNSRQFISDGKVDSITQFRRRDLLVVPAIQKGGQGVGLTVYGGVFTYGSFGLPFRNPIYLRGGAIPSYKLDKSFTQTSNIYATANVVMYDAQKDMMRTTAFGGMGEDTLSKEDGDAFTKKIITINKSNVTNLTAEIVNPTGTPTYIGAESIFITAPNVPMYNANFDVINYNSIPPNKPILIGYIYGGILSNSSAWNQQTNPTTPTNRVYEVYLTK